ncbi:hypothetical protein [Herbaspirillum sp. RV1423]|uniref:hypothetical protein n=1 Tax=Herbaspirillum sp. RV1423 TaxID=1443993 RepID=UPI00054E83F5|nr:hypothetical protein [Herbaspirillum sp. RV1423]
MKALVKEVAWTASFDQTVEKLTVRADMLWIDSSDMQHLQEGPERPQSITESPATSTQHKTSRPGKRPGLYQEIILAQVEAIERQHDPQNADVIWGILCNGVGASTYPRLHKYDRNGIWFHSGDGLKPYTLGALKKYLNPNKTKKHKAVTKKKAASSTK